MQEETQNSLEAGKGFLRGAVEASRAERAA